MNGEGLTWTLDLEDSKFTSGAGRAVRAAITLQTETNNLTVSMSLLDGGTSKLTVTLGNLGESGKRAHGGLLSLAEGIKGPLMGALGAMATAVTTGIMALDKFGSYAVEAFGERSSTIKAYTTLLGDAKQAQIEFGKAQWLSQQTDLTSTQTERSQKALITAGYRDEKLWSALNMVADVTTAADASQKEEAREAMTRLLVKTMGGGITGNMLHNEAMTAGLSPLRIKQEMGPGGKSQGPDADFNAIARALMGQFHTDKLGQFATQSAGSITSLLSNRDEAFKNVLKGFDSDNLSGTEHYKAALKEQGDAMSLTTESGKDLSLTMQHLSDVSLNLKGTVTEFATAFLESFSGNYINELQAAGYTMDDSAKGFKSLGDSAKEMGTAIGKVGTVAADLTMAFDKMSPVIDVLKHGVMYLGEVTKATGEFIGITMGAVVDTLMHPTHAAENAKNAVNASLAVGGAVLGHGSLWGVEEKKPAALLPAPATANNKALAKAKAAAHAHAARGHAEGHGGSGGEGGGDTYHTVHNNVEIVINGGKDSAHQIADEVETRLIRRLGRYAHNPSPGRV